MPKRYKEDWKGTDQRTKPYNFSHKVSPPFVVFLPQLALSIEQKKKKRCLRVYRYQSLKL